MLQTESDKGNNFCVSYAHAEMILGESKKPGLTEAGLVFSV